jgi:hypothetical protein
MNRELLELMGSQLGLSGEQAAKLAAGDLSVALYAMAGTDPMARAMAAAMSASLASSERARARSQDSEGELASVDVRRLRLRLRSLERRLATAEDILGTVADILGACRCFGLEANCVDCNGQGVPGSYPPADPQVFLSWVEGGLRHLGLPLQLDASAPPQQTTRTGTLHG